MIEISTADMGKELSRNREQDKQDKGRKMRNMFRDLCLGRQLARTYRSSRKVLGEDTGKVSWDDRVKALELPGQGSGSSCNWQW